MRDDLRTPASEQPLEQQAVRLNDKIKTTGKAGGLLYAYKAPLPAALKAHESLPPAPPSLATPKGVLFYLARSPSGGRKKEKPC